MRAAVLRPGAETPSVEQAAVPTPGTEELALEVCAAALNPVDLRVAAGTHPTIRPPRPYVVGFEGVGRVTGDGGRRVWWLGGFGSLAERAVAPAAEVIDVPEPLPDDAAAAIGISGMAAWLSLVHRARMQPGDRVLVLGATGGVGRFAVQLARLLGADRVVAAARSASDELLELGADAVVRLSPTGDVAAGDLLRASPEGYDVVVDPLFGAPGQAAIEAAAVGARIVVLGRRAGDRVTLPAKIYEEGLTIIGHRNSATPIGPRRDAYRAVAEHMAAGRLRADRDVLALDEVTEAWRRQATSPHRKLVLIP
jgi:NADPH2:quinone reductase